MFNQEKKYVELPEEDAASKVDFDSLVMEYEELVSRPSLDNENIKDILCNINEDQDSPEQMTREEAILQRVYEKIKNAEINFPFNALAFFDELVKNGKVTERRDGKSATYYPYEGGMAVNTEEISLTPSNILLDLATNGKSEEIILLHHEQVHSHQYLPPGELGRKLRNRMIGIGSAVGLSLMASEVHEAAMIPVILFCTYRSIKWMKNLENKHIKEIQAYVGTNTLATPKRLSDKLKKDYGAFRGLKKVDKFISGYIMIKKLYCLGLRDKEIGEMVMNAKWDKKDLAFHPLDQRIKDIMNEKGVSDEDLNDMMLAWDISRKIDIEKIKLIVQEELINELGNSEKALTT